VSNEATPAASDNEVTAIEHGGFRYAYRVVPLPGAEMAPILLVGGAFQTMTSWGRLERALRARAPLVTVDLPGWGAADTLPARYGIDFLVEALHRVLVDADLPPLHIGSGSYGTAIAYRLAQRYPRRVRRMVLIGTMLGIPAPVWAGVRATLEPLRAGSLAEFADLTSALFVCQGQDAAVRNRAVVNRILRRRFASLTPDEAEKYLQNTLRLRGLRLPRRPAMGTPTLVLTGEHDSFTTPQMCRGVAELCADAWFTTIRDADHMVHLERPDETAELMLRFFTWPASSPGTWPGALPSWCHPVERIRPRPPV
jgi:pimeloyl-ACP methyl ester carboxylesterase